MLQMQTTFIYREFLYADIRRIKRIGSVGAVFEQFSSVSSNFTTNIDLL